MIEIKYSVPVHCVTYLTRIYCRRVRGVTKYVKIGREFLSEISHLNFKQNTLRDRGKVLIRILGQHLNKICGDWRRVLIRNLSLKFLTKYIKRSRESSYLNSLSLDPN